MSIYSYQVSGSFNSLAGVLFNFPSRYSYAIGLHTYLGLGVDGPHVPAQYPVSSTLEIAPAQFSFHYGTITLFGITFQKTLRRKTRAVIALQTPHFHILSYVDSVCPERSSLADTSRISVDFFSCGY